MLSRGTQSPSWLHPCHPAPSSAGGAGKGLSLIVTFPSPQPWLLCEQNLAAHGGVAGWGSRPRPRGAHGRSPMPAGHTLLPVNSLAASGVDKLKGRVNALRGCATAPPGLQHRAEMAASSGSCLLRAEPGRTCPCPPATAEPIPPATAPLPLHVSDLLDPRGVEGKLHQPVMK